MSEKSDRKEQNTAAGLWLQPQVRRNVAEYLGKYSRSGILDLYVQSAQQEADRWFAQFVNPKSPHRRSRSLGRVAAIEQALPAELPIVATKLWVGSGYNKEGKWRRDFDVDLVKINPQTGEPLYGSYVVVGVVDQDNEITDFSQTHPTLFNKDALKLVLAQAVSLEELGAHLDWPEALNRELGIAS